MLEAQSIGFTINGKEILKNIDLSIAPREKVAVMGLSGSGKSTLLKLLSGLEEPTTGKIYFEGERLWGPRYKHIPGHEAIQIINQDNKLDIFRTVEQNIVTPIMEYTEPEKEERLNELIGTFGISSVRTQQIRPLSGGEQKRTAWAKAVAEFPELLILDEPFNGLDWKIKTEIIDFLLKELDAHESALLIAVHEPEDAFRFADRIIVIEDHQIIYDGSIEELYSNPRLPGANYLGPIVNLDGNLTRPESIKLTQKGLPCTVVNQQKLLNRWEITLNYKDTLFPIYLSDKLEESSVHISL